MMAAGRPSGRGGLGGWNGGISPPIGKNRTNPACVPWSPAMTAPASLILPCLAGGWGGAMGHPWGRNVSGGSWVPWSLVQIAPRVFGVAVILEGNAVVEESSPSKYTGVKPPPPPAAKISVALALHGPVPEKAAVEVTLAAPVVRLAATPMLGPLSSMAIVVPLIAPKEDKPCEKYATTKLPVALVLVTVSGLALDADTALFPCGKDVAPPV